MVSPEIHFHKNTYWITYSMNAQGTGLLKSTTGKPEGPYEDLGRFTGQGTDASLFVDDDGTGYWLVGQGWLAKLKPDWTGLAEHPQLLRWRRSRPSRMAVTRCLRPTRRGIWARPAPICSRRTAGTT